MAKTKQLYMAQYQVSEGDSAKRGERKRVWKKYITKSEPQDIAYFRKTIDTHIQKAQQLIKQSEYK